MSAPRLRCTILLPLLSLAIGISLVLVPSTLAFIELERLAGNSNRAVLSFGNFTAAVPRHQFFSNSVMWGTLRTAHLIGALDIPGSVAMIAGHPKGITLDAWRSLILAFSSLPFWWFAGWGIDAALKRREAGWPILLIGTALMAVCVILVLGFGFGLSSSERAESDLGWVIVGFCFWGALFASFPYAWARQRTRQV